MHYRNLKDLEAALGPRAAAQARAALSEDARSLLAREARKVSDDVLSKAPPVKVLEPCLIDPKDLESRREALTVEFPDLVLGSANAMLGSGKREGQTDARRAAQRAAGLLATRWQLGGVRLWRVPGRVDVEVVQYSPRPIARIDPDNIWCKYLLDLLTESHRGIPIIADDNARVVRSVKKGNAFGPCRVEVKIVPAMEEA